LRLDKNNEGMTLIELIISMAITAIVLTMIILIISVAANGFRRTNENVNLQLEAQITINQLSALAMETNEIKESDKLTNPDVRYLLKGTTYSYAITFIKAKNKLYLVQKDTLEEVDAVNPLDNENEYLLAEYVDKFEIAFEDKKTANISIIFKLGDEEYPISKKVKLRNVK
jgi:prepilin-type N-terminal cleavage/methylation domain-containing protein